MKRIIKKQYRDSARTTSTAEVKPRPNEDSLRDVAIATLYRHCERSDVASVRAAELIPNNQRVFGHGLDTPSSTLLRLLQSCLLCNDDNLDNPNNLNKIMVQTSGLATPSSASLRLLREACPEQSVGTRNDDVVWTSSCVSLFSIFTRKSSGANFQFSIVEASHYAIDFGLSALCRLHKITPSGIYTMKFI
jgi:hypothetical protein